MPGLTRDRRVDRGAVGGGGTSCTGSDLAGVPSGETRDAGAEAIDRTGSRSVQRNLARERLEHEALSPEKPERHRAALHADSRGNARAGDPSVQRLDLPVEPSRESRQLPLEKLRRPSIPRGLYALHQGVDLSVVEIVWVGSRRVDDGEHFSD